MGVPAEQIIDRVYGELGRRPLPGEVVDTDADAMTALEVTFSKENLLGRLNRAQRRIVSSVKLQHLPGLWGSPLRYEGSNNPSDSGMVRPLLSRIFRNVEGDGAGAWKRCVRRSVGESRRLQRTSRAATPEYPTFVYDDGALRVLPAGGVIRFFYVPMPDPIALSDLGTASGETVVPPHLERALVMLVVASCYQTMEQQGLSDWAEAQYTSAALPFSTDIRRSPLWEDKEVDVL